MPYRIIVEKRVEKDIKNIPHRDRNRIDHEILSLTSNPRPPGSKKLTEKEGYRIRAGNYRILYTIDDQNGTVVIYRIKIRSERTYK